MNEPKINWDTHCESFGCFRPLTQEQKEWLIKRIREAGQKELREVRLHLWCALPGFAEPIASFVVGFMSDMDGETLTALLNEAFGTTGYEILKRYNLILENDGRPWESIKNGYSLIVRNLAQKPSDELVVNE